MLRFLLALVLVLAAAVSTSAQETALETCDVLPIVEVRVSGAKFYFLVDTAATSILNMSSFRAGESRTIAVTSWSGTAETKATQVRISDLSLGDRHFENLVLPAVDLSGIGRACGRQIDGILGIDLLRKLGAVLDLRDHTPRLRIDLTTESRLKELDERVVSCAGAFNRQDQAAMSACLEPEAVIFTPAGDFHGRERLMEFFQYRFLSEHSHAQLSVKPSFYTVFGDAVWMEYEVRVNTQEKTAVSRCGALWSKADGDWRIVHLSLGAPRDDKVAVSNH
jgi:ketosteroid isomerase-like protein